MFELTGDDRSLAPSPRRVAESRRNGDAPRSRELTAAVAALSAAAVLGLLGGDLWTAATGLMQACWAAPVTRFAELDIVARVGPQIARLMLLVATSIGLPALAAAIVAALQGGFRITQHLPGPRWSHVSPASGWRRMRAGAGFVPCISSGLRIALPGLIAAWMLRGDWPNSEASDPASLIAVIGESLTQLGLLVATAAVAVGVGDWSYRRLRFSHHLRMTPAEARAEARDSTPRRRPRTARPDRVSALPPATSAAADGQPLGAGAADVPLLSFDPLIS